MNFKGLKQIGIKTKIGIFILLSLVVIILLGYFVALPSAIKIVAIKEDIEQRRAEIERRYKTRKQMGDTTKYIEQIRSDIGVLNSPFVNDDQKLEFITSLEDAAANNGVEQKIDLQPQEAEPQGFYDIIPVRITTVGSFEDQFNYLIELESLDEYLNVNYLQISSASSESEEEEKGESKRVRMLIKADTFWCDKIKG